MIPFFTLRPAVHAVHGPRRGKGARALAGAAALMVAAFASAAPAAAQNRDITFIRDTETENTIRVYLAPILEAAGYDPSAVKVHIIKDSAINAFVTGGMKIFIHTGLFTETERPGEAVGVLAHEVGHITGGHLSRYREGMENAQIKSIAAMILGGAAAVAAGKPQGIGAAVSLGQQIGQRSMLQYSREMERSADQAAMDFLRQAGISPRGYKTVLERLHEKEKLYSGSPNPYTRSHPISRDRIAFVEHQIESWPSDADGRMAEKYQDLHDRTRAKLAAYIDPPERTLKAYPESDNSLPARYARAIAHMQAYRVEEALAGAEALIADNPKDPFFRELKGDILLQDGRVEAAMAPLEKTVEMLPWAALVRIKLARAMLETNDPAHLDPALDHLLKARRYEANSSELWRLTAAAYDRKGNTGQVALAQAERTIRSGAPKEAAAHARRAMELLKTGSPSWLRAQDIALQAEDAEAD